jgi:hypothetical protein
MKGFDELVTGLEQHASHVTNPIKAEKIKGWIDRFRDLMTYPDWANSRGNAEVSCTWRITAWLERFRQIKDNPDCENAHDLGVEFAARDSQESSRNDSAPH